MGICPVAYHNHNVPHNPHNGFRPGPGASNPCWPGATYGPHPLCHNIHTGTTHAHHPGPFAGMSNNDPPISRSHSPKTLRKTRITAPPHPDAAARCVLAGCPAAGMDVASPSVLSPARLPEPTWAWPWRWLVVRSWAHRPEYGSLGRTVRPGVPMAPGT
jgi:hypothetical protein